MQRGKYKLGEGITGRVIETGKAVADPQDQRGAAVSGSHRHPPKIPDGPGVLLHLRADQKGQTGHRGAQRRPALSRRTIDLKQGKKLLSVIATMIAQHVINLETIRMEQEHLREENQRLSGRAGEQIQHHQHHRQQQQDARSLPDDLPGVQEQRHRADSRRKRHRQGAGGQLHPLQQPAGQAARSSRSTARPCPPT